MSDQGRDEVPVSGDFGTARSVGDLPVITGWEKPSEGWLRITVKEPLLGMSEAYYWCEQNEGTDYNRRNEWRWRKWSMAGKPTVKVTEPHAAILSNLVLGHDVLRHVGADMGVTFVPVASGGGAT